MSQSRKSKVQDYGSGLVANMFDFYFVQDINFPFI